MHILNVYKIIFNKLKNTLKKEFWDVCCVSLEGVCACFQVLAVCSTWGSWKSAVLIMCQSKSSLWRTPLHLQKGTFVIGCLSSDGYLFVGKDYVMCSWLHIHFTTNCHYLTVSFSMILPFFAFVCSVCT